MPIPQSVINLALPHDVKPIADKPSYFVTYDGRVISIKLHGSKIGTLAPDNPRILKKQTMGNGYHVVFLDGESCYVHRLVATAFKGQPLDDDECRHLDGDKTNNHADNLEWGTKQDNHADSVAHGTNSPPPHVFIRGEQNGQSKLTVDDVREIRRLLKSTDLTYREIAEQFPVKPRTISDIKHRRNWKWLD